LPAYGQGLRILFPLNQSCIGHLGFNLGLRMNNREVFKKEIHATSLIMQALWILSFYKSVSYKKMVTNTQLTNNQSNQFPYRSESDRKIQLTE